MLVLLVHARLELMLPMHCYVLLAFTLLEDFFNGEAWAHMCNSIFLDGVLVDRLRFALSIEMWSCRERWYHDWEL
jgi:hypothetical protein